MEAQESAAVSAAVVILNWNGESHLSRFLPSVVEHTAANVDIVVADNGSTDGSIELLLREFPTVKIVQLDINYGFAEGYNRAIEQVDYDYLVLLNSDVEVTSGWVEPLLEEIASSNDIGAVAPKILSLSDPSHFEHAGAAGGCIDYLGYPFCRGRILSHTEQDSGQYDTPCDIFWASGAAFACRRDTFISFGGFCAAFFAHMEEIDLCWRMQLAGYSIRYQPQSVVYHLGGGTLQSSSPRKLYLNHRNNLAMLLRCAPPMQLLVAMPLRLLLDGLSAVSYLFSAMGVKGFVAVVRAHFSIWCSLFRLLHERHAIRSSVKSESKHIYHGSIILSYLFGRRGR